MINTNIASGTPLEDVLPWTATRRARTTTETQVVPQTILVNDSSIECDGRFLLYLTAATALKDNDNDTTTSRIHSASSSSSSGSSSSSEGIKRILWLTNGGWTTQLVAQALKKMTCPPSSIQTIGGGGGKSSSQNIKSISSSSIPKKKLIQIRSLTQEIGHFVQDLPPNQTFCAQDYIKSLYQEIKQWWLSQTAQLLLDTFMTKSSTTCNETTTSNNNPMSSLLKCCCCWLILDDVSALSALVGSRLTYALVMQLQALSVKSKLSWSSSLSSSSLLPFGIMIRCSLDPSPPQASISTSCWVGAGGSKQTGSGNGNGSSDDDFICWEQGLVEIADQIVDVIPMASGYSSNVHGRLILTQSPRHTICTTGPRLSTAARSQTQLTGASSSSSSSSLSSPLVVNYCLTDNKVLAFRIIQSAS